jgi:hypothetical protein
MGSKIMDKWFGVDPLPDAPKLPAETEEVDVQGQKYYMKKRLASKQGRKSTILSKVGTSSASSNKKTVLG